MIQTSFQSQSVLENRNNSKSMEHLNRTHIPDDLGNARGQDIVRNSVAKVENRLKQKENIIKSTTALPVATKVIPSTSHTSPMKDDAQRIQQTRGSPAIVNSSVLPLIAEVC